MRFGLAHKLATYLMAACAFFALALSGQLSPLAVCAAGLAIAASWPIEPPRVSVERLAPALSAAAALLFVVELARALATGEAVPAGARFLLGLLAIKMVTRRTNKDYLHIYVVTFLMLVAATVLNPGPSFGLAFTGYVIASTWALILFHLRRDMEDNHLIRHGGERGAERVELGRILSSRRIVGAPFFAGVALASLTIFALSCLVFFAIPRVGFGVLHDRDSASLHVSGLGDSVTLGGHGVIRDDPSVVMRVRFEDPALVHDRALHWRGVALDHYENGRWRRSDGAPRTRGERRRRSGVTSFDIDFGGRAPAAREGPGEIADDGFRQDIYLEPLDSDVLLGASLPVRFEVGGPRGKLRATQNDELRYPHESGVAYTAYSRIDRPAPDTLRAAPAAIPEGYEAYLQLPDSLSARVTELAADITAGAGTHYDKVAAIEAWLGDFGYTRELSTKGSRDPLEHFLFERRKGHCEYFASALAILARAAGVPARTVNGFVGGEWNDIGEYLAVRAGDAHSWTEIYFHGVGWVEFDPTPLADRPGTDTGGGVFGALRDFGDALRFRWFQWVVEYDLGRQLDVLGSVESAVRAGADVAVVAPMRRAGRWTREHAPALAGVTGVVIAAVVALALARRLPRARHGRREYAGGTRAAYEAAQAQLRRRGYGRPPAFTPREHASQLRARGVPGAEAYGELAELYYACRYGGAETGAMRERAARLHADITRALSQNEDERRRERTPGG